MTAATLPPAGHLERRASQAGRWLSALWASPSWTACVVALLLAAPVPLMVALCPKFVINFNMHDMFIPLDAAWRTLQGQWPHQDVYSPLGVMYFWQHGLAAWLWGLDGKTVSRASFVALPFVIVPMLVFASARVGTLSTVVLTSFFSLLVTAPTFIDGPAWAISHVASYNRDGAALCGVIALWALAPIRAGKTPSPWLEALLLGLSLWILLYLKVTFFLLAVAFLLLGCTAQRRLWKTAFGSALVVGIGVGIIEAIHPGLLRGYLDDLHRTSASTYNVFRLSGVESVLVANASFCIIILFLTLFGGMLRLGTVHGLAILLAAFVSCIVSMQNYGAFSAPLIVLIVCQLELVHRNIEDRLPALQPAYHGFATAALLLAVLPFITVQTSGAAYMYQKLWYSKKGHEYPLGDESRTLANVIWFPNEVLPEFATVDQALAFPLARIGAEAGSESIADGLRLIKRNRMDTKRIATLAFENPFPFALKAPSPRGIGLWWDFNRTFLLHGTKPDSLIGDADVVMYPKMWFEHYISDLLSAIARPTLEKDFTPYESRCWTMWVRKSVVASP